MSTPRSAAGAERPESDQQRDGRRVARRKLEHIHARTRRIRRNVTVLALALFLATFAGIYLQMASGHDPVLSRHTTVARTTAAARDKRSSAREAATRTTTSASNSDASSGSSSEAASAASDGSQGDSSSSSQSTSTEATGAASSVTTSQS